MLVPRLERRGAAQHEELRGRFLFVRVAGPVVLDLVIVVAHNERRGRVRGLQVRVELMQTVAVRSEEHTSELQSRSDLVCRLLLEKKKKKKKNIYTRRK